jgi:hypothetical protein
VRHHQNLLKSACNAELERLTSPCEGWLRPSLTGRTCETTVIIKVKSLHELFQQATGVFVGHLRQVSKRAFIYYWNTRNLPPRVPVGQTRGAFVLGSQGILYYTTKVDIVKLGTAKGKQKEDHALVLRQPEANVVGPSSRRQSLSDRQSVGQSEQ